MATYNRDEIKKFVDYEITAQYFMDNHYSNYGWLVDRSSSCRDYDCILYKDTQKIKVEEKFRNGDYGDLLIEIQQCLETNEAGWLYYVKADYLNYVICDGNGKPKKFYSIRWGKFKTWLFEYLKRKKYQKIVISPKGKGISLNLAITWSMLPNDCYFLRIDISSEYKKDDLPPLV